MRYFVYFLSILVCLVFTRAVFRHFTNTPKQPSFFLISIDTARWSHLKLGGYFRDTMPTLTKLAEENIYFSHTRANSTFTTPSHMSIFTGLLPIYHKVFEPFGASRDESERFNPLPSNISTMAEYFVNQGFKTQSFYHERDFYLSPLLGFGRGFQKQHPFGMDSNYATEEICKNISESNGKNFYFIHSKRPHLPYSLPEKAGGKFLDKNQMPKFEWREEKIMRKALSGPILISIGIPGIFPEQMFFLSGVKDEIVKRKNDKAVSDVVNLYDSALYLTDTYLNRLINCIRGKFPDANIAITSDHGEELFEKKRYGHAYPYETVIRIPLVFIIPSLKLSGIKVEGIAQSIDILPTVLAMYGFSEDNKTNGVNLLPFMVGKGDLTKITDRPHFSFTVRKMPPAIHSYLNGDWKFIADHFKQEYHLFNIKSDPEEKNDLYLSEKSRVDEMRRKLNAKLSELD